MASGSYFVGKSMTVFASEPEIGPAPRQATNFTNFFKTHLSLKDGVCQDCDRRFKQTGENISLGQLCARLRA